MESNADLEKVVMNVEIEELENELGNKVVNFVVKDLDTVRIELSNSEVDDIKELFDKIFDYVITQRLLITFELEGNESSLFFEVASDLVKHLNNEIEQSEENFQKLIIMQDGANND